MLINKIISIALFITIYHLSIFASECNKDNNITVGLVKNDYIDYSDYLYYTLGKYTSINSTKFELIEFNSHHDDFDIIFGEYSILKELDNIEFSNPIDIEKFYKKNGIKIKNNIFPLDLDTFIILSSENQKVFDFQDLTSHFNRNKYTLGLSFKSKYKITNLINYHLEVGFTDFNETNAESVLNLFNKSFSSMNKNILQSSYNDVYQSYINQENVFTVFGDGILLYKNLNFSSYQLFPKSRYYWEEVKGNYIENQYTKPLSFFGFSAYVKNSDGFGFLCYLLDPYVRNLSFKNFNIELSPISVNDLNFKNDLPNSYIKILEEKNKNIHNSENIKLIDSFENIKEVIFNQKEYEYLIDKNYLN